MAQLICESTRVVSVSTTANNNDKHAGQLGEDSASARQQRLAQLLDGESLLTLPEVADKLGIAVTRVYDMLRDKRLVAWDSSEGRRVPELFFTDKSTLSKYVAGVITVLADGGFSDTEILEHLFTPDDSLPGRPIDGLHGHLAREVIRRAQALAL